MMSRRSAVFGVLLALSGCDDGGAAADDPERLDAAIADAATQDGGLDQHLADATPGADAARDAAAPPDAAIPDAAIPDAASPDAIQPADAGVVCPEDDPVLRTVRIVVRNASAGTRYVPIRGDLCEGFRVNDADGRRIPNRVVNICTADCACIAGTPESWATAWRRLEPGESLELTWAAQRVERCEREVHCPDFENTGRPERFPVATPYRTNIAPMTPLVVDLAYTEALRDDCPDIGEEVDCMGDVGMNWFDICEASGRIEQPFELTVEDETRVEIDLP